MEYGPCLLPPQSPLLSCHSLYPYSAKGHGAVEPRRIQKVGCFLESRPPEITKDSSFSPLFCCAEVGLWFEATMMTSLPCPTSPPRLRSDGIEGRSDLGLDPIHTRSLMSKGDISHRLPGLEARTTAFSKVAEKERTRDAGVKCTTKAQAHTTTPSPRTDEEKITSPLRRVLARRSVKKQIFSYMDRGDRKIDIESRTGLSHQCIKWHRRLWRHECSHPRPRSKRPSRSSSPNIPSRNTRGERSSRKRPASRRSSDSLALGESSREKRRRKDGAMKQLNECSARLAAKVIGSDRDKCTERETESGSFVGKENVPERDEAMVMAGELKVLPIRDLGRRGGL